MMSNNFFSAIKFYDDVNYPRGFSRSGDFSIKEAELLENSGYIIKKLVNKEMSPENEEQEHFLQVIAGNAEPLYLTERVYLKYLNLLEKKKSFVPSVRRATQSTYIDDGSQLDA